MARPITVKPFLWLEKHIEEAAALYVSLFPGSRIVTTTRWGSGGPAPAGSIQTCTVELAGLPVVLFEGGPHFRLNEAFSLSVDCETQEEVDTLWARLTADGGAPLQCGWCKDRFGVSWQIVPEILPRLLQDPDPGRATRTAQAMMKMEKLDIAALKRAAAGE